MSIDLPQSLLEYVALIGGCCGLIALLWNIAKWVVNRKRRKRQDALEIENLEKLKHNKGLDWTEERNRLRAKVEPERKKVAAELAVRGVGYSGRAKQRLDEYEQDIRKQIETLTRNHEAEVRAIDVKIAAIKNRPFQ